jgi:hypothetical protein
VGGGEVAAFLVEFREVAQYLSVVGVLLPTSCRGAGIGGNG